MMQNENGFVGYEYAEVTVPRSMEGLWTDSYKSFGWNLTKSEPAVVKPLWGPIRLRVAPLALIPGSPFAKVITHRDSVGRFGVAAGYASFRTSVLSRRFASLCTSANLRRFLIPPHFDIVVCCARSVPK